MTSTDIVRSRPELIPLLTPRLNKYILHQPTPIQSAFLLLDNYLDVFYGGAAGGGKSDALLMAALQYVEEPGYEALILRSTYQDLALPGAIMDRAKAWLLKRTDATWSEEQKTFTFPSGARLVFGYLDGPNDHYRYQSANFHFVGIDEASQLRWNQALYMFSRLRKQEGCKIPIRFRCASNPGGRSHFELKERYIDTESRGSNRIFIPAGLDDNPFVDRQAYELALSELDWVTRRRLRYGDWEVKEGEYLFLRTWFDILPAIPVQVRKRIRWWDLAATEAKPGKDPDWTSGAKLALGLDNIYYVEDMVHVQERPHNVEKIVQRTAEMDGQETEIIMEQEPGSAGKTVISHYSRNVIPGFNFKGKPSTGDKISYAQPLSAQAETGNVKVIRGPWNKVFFNELESFPQGEHDDQTDAISKAFCHLAGINRKRAGVWGTAHLTDVAHPPRAETTFQPRKATSIVSLR